ncbi:MAG: ABC transporter ATP-binding protein [Nostocales cyanobacterium]|nr:MAG: ABC transporter ATP-binding protein [Nostocales cyanobacterium]TAF19106.1 MAG: ABC transporter ATP-binding protein [Nostocales cyanobacterium]
MSDVVIRVDNLSKKYIIGHQNHEGYTALRDVIANKVKSLSNLINPKTSKDNSPSEDFWAVKDVGFEVKQGDRVGIIGRNGAGKSTLLKILSRITEPTTGRISIKGRVASLLEVGTGFHGELTGRENIFLNGAILGMSKAEIKHKFDEIVAFSEVEKFLDTPVKRYSSGMYVRLAFAVAAHLEPEILIVDEVLAVGDTAFQQKCLGKMEEVGREGRTVLFVSHNMGTIEKLCNQGLYLKSGKIQCSGKIESCLNEYWQSLDHKVLYAPGTIYKLESINQLTKFSIVEITLLDEQEFSKSVVRTWDYLRIRIRYFCPQPIPVAGVDIAIHTFSGSKLIHFSTKPLSGMEISFTEGFAEAHCVIPRLPLASGNYRLSVGLSIPMRQWLCWEEGIATLEVKDKDVYNSLVPPDQNRTPIAIEHYWEIPEKTALATIN